MDALMNQISEIYYKENIIFRESILEFIFWQNDCFLDVFDRPWVFNILSLHKIKYEVKNDKLCIGNKAINKVNGLVPWEALARYHEKYLLDFGNEKKELLYPFFNSNSFHRRCCMCINGKYTYIRIEDFGEVKEWKLKSDPDKILIIDLRGNSGGNINNMIGILKRFVNGTLFFLRHKSEVYKVSAEEKVKIIYKKIYLIVDEQTASSAEMFAYVLREKLGVEIIGKKTYGKWTVHRIIHSGEFFFKIPQYKFISYKSAEFENYEGIQPDILMENTAVDIILQNIVGGRYESI